MFVPQEEEGVRDQLGRATQLPGQREQRFEGRKRDVEGEGSRVGVRKDLVDGLRVEFVQREEGHGVVRGAALGHSKSKGSQLQQSPQL